MNDLKNIVTLIRFVEDEIAKINTFFNEDVKFNSIYTLADKSYYFGKMEALMDLRDKMTKLRINIIQPQLFEVNEYQPTRTSAEDQF
jgi:hypothetical protein